MDIPARVHRGFAATLIVVLGGCNLFVPLALVGEHTKTVLPEFDKLAGRRVAVLVWTEPATLFNYPYARLELASYVSDKLRYELTRRNERTEVVEARVVEDLLQKDPEARVDPQKVGRRVGADYVIYIEVLRFQMRNPDEPQFIRGHIEASVVVHEVAREGERAERFVLTPVHAVYPETGPILLTATNPPLVREATYRLFAELVARKFYEYKVQL